MDSKLKPRLTPSEATVVGQVIYRGRVWIFRRDPGRKTYKILPPSGRSYPVSEARFLNLWLDVNNAGGH